MEEDTPQEGSEVEYNSLLLLSRIKYPLQVKKQFIACDCKNWLYCSEVVFVGEKLEFQDMDRLMQCQEQEEAVHLHNR